MAVQSEILTRTVTQILPGTDVKFVSGTGTLAMGIPGKIYDTFPGQGPGSHTTVLKERANVGSFLPGHGIIVNSPEYALEAAPDTTSALAANQSLKAGTVVTCVTMGHVIVKESEVEAILAGMNGSILKYPTEMFDDDDESDASDASDADSYVVVEVLGLKKS